MTRDETREAAKIMTAWADGAEVEYKFRESCSDTWESFLATPTWNFVNYVYRIKRKETFIDWDALHEDIVAVYKEPNEMWYGAEENPEQQSAGWDAFGIMVYDLSILSTKVFRPGAEPWEESLHVRPGVE